MKKNKELLIKINNIINHFKNDPEEFDNNVYRCYNRCKNMVYKFEEEGKIDWDDSYIDYITEKLGI